MKGKKLLVTLAVSALMFTGCGFKGGNTIIKVNDTKITQAQFDKKLNAALGNSMLTKMGVDVKNGKNTFLLNLIKIRVVNDLVVTAMLDEEMDKRGIKVSNKDTEEAIKEIIDKVGSKEQLDQILKQNGMTAAEFKRDLKEQVKIKKLAEQLGEVNVSDAEAKKFYNDNISKFKHPEQVRASHILLAANESDLAEVVKVENEGISEADVKKKVAEKVKEKRAAADEILAQVKKDPTQFAKIAKEKSEDPGSAQDGGDLGFFEKGKMVPEFEKAAFSMKPNTVSDIVKTRYGYHIIYVTDRRAAGQDPYEKVEKDIKDYIKNMKQHEKVEDLIEALKKNAKIEYVDEAYNPEKLQEEVQKQLDPQNQPEPAPAAEAKK